MRNRKLAILGFHRVLPQRDVLQSYPDAREFEGILRMLSTCFNVLPLQEGVHQLKEGRLPSRALCITFDDGYLDNLTVALPLLKKFNLPSTCFVASGFLNGDCMWNDKVTHALRSCASSELDLTSLGLSVMDLSDSDRRSVAINNTLKHLKYLAYDERAHSVEALLSLSKVDPMTKRLMMTADEVRQLHSAGVEIGAHTETHPILRCMPPERAKKEIQTSKLELEQIIGQDVISFAYPNGRPSQDYERRHVDMVQDQGFELAVSTHWGCAEKESDRFQLPRMAVYGKSLLKSALRLLRSYYQRNETSSL